MSRLTALLALVTLLVLVASSSSVPYNSFFPKRGSAFQAAHAADERYAQAINDLLVKFVPLAKSLSRLGRTIAITMVNDAFIPFTLSWLCNTRSMDVHQQIIIIATDQRAFDQLSTNEYHVPVLKLAIPSELSGDLTYGAAGYYRFMLIRTYLLAAILRNEIDLWLFETDAVWFQNALTHPSIDPSVDLVGQIDVPESQAIGGGFLRIKSSSVTTQLFQELAERFHQHLSRQRTQSMKQHIGDISEQLMLNEMLNHQPDRLRVQKLSRPYFVTGQWYPNIRDDGLALRQEVGTQVVSINFNWISGNHAKIERAKQWGHWFLTALGKCDELKLSQLAQTLQVYP